MFMEEQKFSYSWIIDPNQACDFDLSETKEALDKQISLMVAQPEKFDIAVAIASGFLSGVIELVLLD